MKPSRPLVETTPLPAGLTLAQALPIQKEVPWTHPGNDVVIGYDEADRPVILTYQDRARHVYIPGRTGTGKSRLLGSAIRQDIAKSRETNCPVVVFDLHGELVNSVLGALACDVQSHDLPIVYIDVTNRDAILTWNPLKRHPSVDPAVSARLLAEAVMHASGKLDLMQAPTLQRTMSTFFHVGIERGLTLPQLFELADPSASALRAEIAASIGDVRTRADLERMNSITKQRLEEEMLALHNRLSGLTGTPYLRAMMGSAEQSFDFGWALDTGAIVLVNLATRGGTLAETDSRMLASLMLTELWQAAQQRGKGAAGERRPCYVYVDEAPFIATPTIALQLAQARGFGLHFTLAAQATSQFEDFGGPHGHAIKKAVLRDTLSKVILGQTADEGDITPLARELVLAAYDPYLRKHTSVSHQVVGEEKVEYWTTAHITTEAEAVGQAAAIASSKQRSTGTNWSSARAQGGNAGTSYSHSTSDGIDTPELGTDESRPSRVSHAVSDAHSANDQSTWSESDTNGGNTQEGEGVTRTRSRNRQKSTSDSVNDQQHFRWRPIIEQFENPQFFSFDDQLRMCEQMLFTLHPRHALVSRQGMVAVEIATPTVRDPEYIDPEWVEDLLAQQRSAQSFWRSRSAAEVPMAPIASPTPPTRLRSYGRRATGSATPTGDEGSST